MTRNTTLSGKPSMPCAWSAQVYGKVRPMLTDDVTWERIYRGLVWANASVWGLAAAIAIIVIGGSL